MFVLILINCFYTSICTINFWYNLFLCQCKIYLFALKTVISFGIRNSELAISRQNILSKLGQYHVWRYPGSSWRWRHNGYVGVSSHQPQPFIQAQIKETSKLRVTGLCAGNLPVTGEFSTQMASNADNVSIWRRHHVCVSRTPANMILSIWFEQVLVFL